VISFIIQYISTQSLTARPIYIISLHSPFPIIIQCSEVTVFSNMYLRMYVCVCIYTYVCSDFIKELMQFLFVSIGCCGSSYFLSLWFCVSSYTIFKEKFFKYLLKVSIATSVLLWILLLVPESTLLQIQFYLWNTAFYYTSFQKRIQIFIYLYF
jgi:hypothetical protein